MVLLPRAGSGGLGFEEHAGDEPLNPCGADLFDNDALEGVGVFVLEFLAEVLDSRFDFSHGFFECLVNGYSICASRVMKIAKGFEGDAANVVGESFGLFDVHFMEI